MLLLRPDLLCQPIHADGVTSWVLKDPVSNQRHQLTSPEMDLLRLLDGTRDLAAIFDASQRLLPARYLTPETLVHFLAHAKRSGLLTLDGRFDSQLSSTRDEPSLPRWNPLRLMAWRFPGITPEPHLSRLTSWLRSWASLYHAIAYVGLLLVAGLIAIMNADEIMREAAQLARLSLGQSLVPFLMTIAMVKVLHECGHAIACRWCEANCREIGIMLLLGMPTLYCDVSDAWMLPQRRQRILVSAAGMLVELLIAAVATVVWLLAIDPTLRAWCLLIMLTCSVNTLLVNGNPLLKYDGYFMLADWLRIPNLAERGKECLQQLLSRLNGSGSWLRSIDNNGPHFGLLVFGLLSILYRYFLLLAVAVAIYRYSWAHGFAAPGLILSICLLVGALVPEIMAMNVSARATNRLGAKRARLRRYAVLACILALGFIPLPQSVRVPMMVQPANQQDLHVTTKGRLVRFAPTGSFVNQGDSIAQFDNPSLQLALAEADTLVASLSTEEQSLNKLRAAEPEIAVKLVTIAASRQAASERAQSLRKELQQLTIIAPQAGRLYPPSQSVDQADGVRSDQTVGTPLQAANVDAWFDSGTPICTLGEPDRRQAFLFVDQRSIQLIRMGDSVSLDVPDRQAYQGIVTQIDTAPVENYPAELIKANILDPAATLPFAATPNLSPVYYRVTVELQNTAQPLAVRTVGQAVVHTKWCGLYARWARTLTQSFR